MNEKPTIVWFRQDLRIADNPALTCACERGSVLPIYILDDASDNRAMGEASLWWLHHSLAALQKALGGLSIFRGDPREIIKQLIEETDAGAVYWNRCYEPEAIERDKEIKAKLTGKGIEVKSYNASLLHEPWTIETGSGDPYKVFTPYWKAASARPAEEPIPAPTSLNIISSGNAIDLKDLNLLPVQPNWADGWDDVWRPGEAGAAERLERFLDGNLKGYGDLRNRPDLPNVSRLSPHLHFGEISPRQIFARIRHLIDQDGIIEKDADKFLSEVGWREFSYHLLFHFPSLVKDNWKPEFEAYPWQQPDEKLTAWQKGQTGYPLVDAGMRELWQTGYMHNRVRMVVASFLVKHLAIDWRHGEAWFWDTLLDADLANNCASWQWVTGSGADAAPYFRIFNPTTQAQKFDPDGTYIRQYCPELADLPTEHIHAPFDAPISVLSGAGVRLGETYPLPIIDHAFARKRALEGYEKVKAAKEAA